MVDRLVFDAENERVVAGAANRPRAKRSSSHHESVLGHGEFLSPPPSTETTKVLTDAALEGRWTSFAA